MLVCDLFIIYLFPTLHFQIKLTQVGFICPLPVNLMQFWYFSPQNFQFTLGHLLGLQYGQPYIKSIAEPIYVKFVPQDFNDFADNFAGTWYQSSGS